MTNFSSLPPAIPALLLSISILIFSQYIQGCQGMNGFKIRSKPCINSIGDEGICMFAWECIRSEGIRLGTCADGFLIGMCCGMPKLVERPLIRRITTGSDPFTSSSTTTTPAPILAEEREESVEEVTETTTRKEEVTTEKEKEELTSTIPVTTELPITITPSNRPSSPVTHIVRSSSPSTLKSGITERPINLVTISTSASSLHVPALNPVGVGEDELTDGGEEDVTITSRPQVHFTSTPLPSTGLSTETPEISYNTTHPTTQQPLNESFTDGGPSTLSIISINTEPATTTSYSEDYNLLDLLNETNSTGSSTSNLVLDIATPFFKATQAPPSAPAVTGGTNEPVDNNTIPVNVINQTQNRPYNNRLDCGHRPLKPQARVVGGRNAMFGEWPWQVLIKEATWLGLFVKTKCGGVLIDHKWVLTAAHCQPGFLGSLVVIVGEYDLTGDFENLKPVAKPVRRMIVHRNYKPDTFENDIALLELESAFEVQPHVIPICLPDAEDMDDYVGHTAHVAGWGKLSYGGPVPSILQVVKLPIIPNNQCQKMFQVSGHHKIIRNTFICAGYTDGGKDSCEGDSGGPLMLQKDGRWTLIGTVSHGIKCAEPNLPGVYMRTSTYMPWISSILRRHSYN